MIYHDIYYESMVLRELMLTKQMNRKSVIFVTIDIFYIKILKVFLCLQ